VDTIHPIYLVGGSKGGVGKSMVTLALADYLQRQGTPAVLLETDTSNPDVMKALRDEIKCAAYDLDDADGWIGFVSFCDTHRGAAVIVNTAARNQTGVARYGGTLARTLAELERQLVVLWVINRQRDSLELLHIFGQTFPDTVTHVVRNGYFGARWRVREILMPASEGDPFSYMDIAVMKIDPGETVTPVRIAGNPDFERVATLQSVCIVGFPGPPHERTGVVDGVDWEWVDRHLFGQAYGFKCVAPGVVHRSSGTFEGDAVGWVFGHDATTLGGNSGSGVFAWHDGGGVFGLHFAGCSLDTNCAHGFSTRRARVLLLALGISCEDMVGPHENEAD
jgi:hypothetical protein